MGCNNSKTTHPDASAASPKTPKLDRGTSRSSEASSGGASKSTAASSATTVASDLGKLAEENAPPGRLFLVVGTPGSGKTTLIRHIRFLHDETYAAECTKFAKSVRQASVRAIQAVVRALPDGACTDHHETIELVKSLGRRDAIDAELAVQVQALWREMPITDAVVQTVDAQTAAAAGYFVPRLATLAGDKFVPDVEDVLRLTAATVGRQETRLKEMHGGPLALLEVGGAGDTNIAQAETGDDTLSDRLDAVICVISALDITVEPNATNAAADSGEHAIRVSPEALATWAEAQAAAGRHGARACLVISKSDLLQTILPEGLSATRAVWLLRAQLGVDDDEWSAGARALSLLDGRETREGFGRLIRSVYPESDDEDDDGGCAFTEGVYVGLLHFTIDMKGATRVLTRKNSLPAARMPDAIPSLCAADHLWLQQLPRPLPNPSQAISEEDKERLGAAAPKGSLQIAFWAAVQELSTQLGATQPAHLGILHPVPVLVAPGAVLLLFCHEHYLPSSVSKGLKWMPTASAAAKLFGAGVTHGGELYSFRKKRTLSHDATMKEMIASCPAERLHPAAWLPRLCTAHASALVEGEASMASERVALTPGTYVAAFYVVSTIHGFKVLVPEQDHSMVPLVKVSNELLSDADWANMQGLAAAARDGKPLDVPQDWAAAKGWLGPEVGSEHGFTTLQKLFYGVYALRQRLGRDCSTSGADSAYQDDLRYSKVSQAADSLTSLGSLYDVEVLNLDADQQAQVVVFCRTYDLKCDETYTGMRWYPLELFEARHYWRFLPAQFGQYCSSKARLLATRMPSFLGALGDSDIATFVGDASFGSFETPPGRRLSSSTARRSSCDSMSTFTTAAASNGRRSSCDSSSNDAAGTPPSVAKQRLAARRKFEAKRAEEEDNARTIEKSWERLRWTKRLSAWLYRSEEALSSTHLPLSGHAELRNQSPMQLARIHYNALAMAVEEMSEVTSKVRAAGDGELEKNSVTMAEVDRSTPPDQTRPPVKAANGQSPARRALGALWAA